MVTRKKQGAKAPVKKPVKYEYVTVSRKIERYEIIEKYLKKLKASRQKKEEIDMRIKECLGRYLLDGRRCNKDELDGNIWHMHILGDSYVIVYYWAQRNNPDKSFARIIEIDTSGGIHNRYNDIVKTYKKRYSD